MIDLNDKQTRRAYMQQLLGSIKKHSDQIQVATQPALRSSGLKATLVNLAACARLEGIDIDDELYAFDRMARGLYNVMETHVVSLEQKVSEGIRKNEVLAKMEHGVVYTVDQVKQIVTLLDWSDKKISGSPAEEQS